MNARRADEHAADVLRHFGPYPVNWVEPTPTDHDVLVVGAGQAGVGIGFALRRSGIVRTSVIDAAAPGQAGGWATTSRMETLRTPRNWPEPEYGISGLSFQAWYELTHGPAAYARLGQIPRLDWVDYLRWFERSVGVPVRHRTRLVDITPADDHLRLTLEIGDADGGRRSVVETARKLVLATGIEGTGGPYLPPELDGLPPTHLAHTNDPIDMGRLVGRSVAVLGAAASAFDAAATALEAGAGEVHLFSRHPELLVQEPGGGQGEVGPRDHFHRLPDAERWRRRVRAARAGRSAPTTSVLRAQALTGFHVHLDATWRSAQLTDGAVRVVTDRDVHLVDFVIAGTGFQYDPVTRAELKSIAEHVALWRDRYQPPVELAHDALGSSPYVGAGFELQEKVPGGAGWLGRIHAFSPASQMSFGYPIGDVQSLAPAIPRLVDALARDLYLEDQATTPDVTPTIRTALGFP